MVSAAEDREPVSQACAICGGLTNPDSYSACPERDRMRRDGLCFCCALWDLRAEEHERDPISRIIIDGVTYKAGKEPSPDSRRRESRFLGMGGRKFEIELADGACITSHNLWCGGKIPERLRDRMPDNARFLGGAHSAEVGGVRYFNPSR